MDPLGKLSHLGIAKELEFGTPVTALDYLKFSSESLSLNIEELIEGSIQGSNDEAPSLEGLGTIAGNTVHEVHPVGLGHFLRAWFGQPASAQTGTGVYQHIYTPVAHHVPAARRGTATAGTTTTLTDSGKTWTVNQYAGWWLHIIAGTGAGTYRMISANTATELTVATMVAPSTDSVYEIVPGPENSVLPTYTLELHRDLPGAAAAFQYKGMVLNSLQFAVGVGAKILTMTAGWLGKDVGNIAHSDAVSAPTTTPFKWSQVKVGIGLYSSGTATGGGATTLADSALTMATNVAAGKLLVKTNAAGTQIEVRPIASNDATTFTVSPGFVDAAVATDTYKVYNCPDVVESLEFTLENGVVALPTLNYTKRVSRMVADSFRMGNMTMTVIPQDITDYATYYTGWTTREVVVWYKGDVITGNEYNDLTFMFPKVLITAYPVNVGGAGRVTVAMAAKLKYDATAGYMVKSILNNARASYSA